MTLPATPRFGIVGGLGMLGAADLFQKLAQALPAVPGEGPAGVLFEQRPFREGLHPGAAGASQNGRKLYVFDLLRQFEARGVQAVLLPCFLSHTFLAELQDEVRVPVIDMVAALKAHVEARHPAARRLGVLTSDHVRAQRLFERTFDAPGWQLAYPGAGAQAGVMDAVYGPGGLKAGPLHDGPVELLARACDDLLAQGVDLIVPGFAEIPRVIEALRQRCLPVVDSNEAYVRAALSHGREADREDAPARPVKVGVVGGVGPAATVDFLAKLVRHTPAARDQEHLKVVVEQNPQIPDRTAHLVRQGPDPTVALYATCKRLEAAGAAMIAIPCNTAHAFVARLQPSLSIPIVDMLAATAEHLRAGLPAGAAVGLLATTGTVQSGLYADALARVGLTLQVPDAAHQALVMAAIYGPAGVKAGHTTGACVQQLDAALAHLVAQGARAVVLGCTELPLVLAARDDHPVGDTTVPVVDPTALLAQRCVHLARAKARSA